eukprot:CAMPEP_0198287774 /NCGR_PEP_ID=MMETSP1449-20131203/6483_1 /TAXON_ID=420275 /ORGANISM="Attheya septentrionalis, Strain CCMP2084" /LENGTH=261 /DNA_ID=CAMNT_0043985791 /DNA_START=192 /DNA_END=977 /DNA_ORIENTATION=+
MNPKKALTKHEESDRTLKTSNKEKKKHIMIRTLFSKLFRSRKSSKMGSQKRKNKNTKQRPAAVGCVRENRGVIFLEEELSKQEEWRAPQNVKRPSLPRIDEMPVHIEEIQKYNIGTKHKNLCDPISDTDSEEVQEHSVGIDQPVETEGSELSFESEHGTAYSVEVNIDIFYTIPKEGHVDTLESSTEKSPNNESTRLTLIDEIRPGTVPELKHIFQNLLKKREEQQLKSFIRNSKAEEFSKEDEKNKRAVQLLTEQENRMF